MSRETSVPFRCPDCGSDEIHLSALFVGTSGEVTISRDDDGRLGYAIDWEVEDHDPEAPDYFCTACHNSLDLDDLDHMKPYLDREEN